MAVGKTNRQRNGRSSSSLTLTLAILSNSLEAQCWKSGLTIAVEVGYAPQAWSDPPLSLECKPAMATGCFKSWKTPTSFHTPVPVRLAKDKREVLRSPESLATHKKTLLQDSNCANEIPKIPKLKMTLRSILLRYSMPRVSPFSTWLFHVLIGVKGALLRGEI